MPDLFFMMWRGADNVQRLWWECGDRTSPTRALSCAQDHIGSEGSSNSPALSPGERALVWNGGAGDSHLWWSKDERDNRVWGGRPHTLTVGTERFPARANSQDRLFAAEKRGGDDKNTSWMPFAGRYGTRARFRQRGASTSNGPAIASSSALSEPDHGTIPGASQRSDPLPPTAPRGSGGAPGRVPARRAPANPPDDVAHVVDGCAAAVLWFVVVGIVGAVLVPALKAWWGLGQTGEGAIVSLAVLVLWFGGTVAVFMYHVMKSTDAARP